MENDMQKQREFQLFLIIICVGSSSYADNLINTDIDL